MAPKQEADAKPPQEAVEEKAGDEKADPIKTSTEVEGDDPSDTRAKLNTGAVTFHAEDTTLNVMPALDGKLLMSLNDGGFQYLLAGARASVGLTAGRYMYEVAIVENKSQSASSSLPSGMMKLRQVRVGFATAGASLFLDTAEAVCFDSEGIFSSGSPGNKKRIAEKFGQGDVVAVVLNLDPDSPNRDTVSLFKGGVRASKPQPLPEALKGKALFPAVAYRSVTMHLNFGPQPLRPLPFACRMIQDAAVEDCTITAAPEHKDGRCDVVFPVGLPDQGTFDWIDHFLAKSPAYTEISSRAFTQWAVKSGMRPPAGKTDKSFVDELGMLRVIGAVLPTLQRNFVVADVKANLLAEDRRQALARFPDAEFRKVAHVAMGEPADDFKSRVQEALLKAKEDKKAKKRKLDAERKKAEDLRKKKSLEAKKAREAKDEKKEDGKGEEKDKEKDAEDEKKAEEEEGEEDANGDGDKVELTEEEKKQWFRKQAVPDMSLQELSAVFTKFTVPDVSEGFSDVKFEWQAESECKAHLARWVTERKVTQRVETIQPSDWFKKRLSEFTTTLGAWKKKQTEYKDPVKRKAAQQAKIQAAKKKKLDEEKAEGDAEEKGKDAEEAKEEPPKEIDADDIDVFALEDVNDIGNGEPLFQKFTYPDWALLTLRFELSLLLHAFRRDVDDPERQTFHESHLPFYYTKYYTKKFNTKDFGCSDLPALIKIVADAVDIGKNKMMETSLEDDTPFDLFLRLTEEHRRDRIRRVDAGDESAELNFKGPPAPARPPPTAGARSVVAASRPVLPPGNQNASAIGAARSPFLQAPPLGGLRRPGTVLTPGNVGTRVVPMTRPSPYGMPTAPAAYGYGMASPYGKGAYGPVGACGGTTGFVRPGPMARPLGMGAYTGAYGKAYGW
mmetsp:Transcript_47979/g.133820  ORF Transcript_47979/g.133820 Transcript_47979/m.133820 type:complete len:898 (-) Transcript_47979:97-2790(-)|eukprot:CAMPEP_0117466610 /NCGR_PEP_ID=MMETSP0784-20121206/5232_1 /TAXON_ID=39447 /ORGANISM="" /LENGTH=897 /DNA_ID=CAMNT_0005260559 /DNA_START=11 /DNA_END=2704 /DNA_ORIENTATION=+